METFALFLLLLVLSPWKTSCQLDTVAFIRPPPLGADTPEELYQLGFMVTFQWTSATDDPIGLGVWQPNTADDEGDIIFRKSFGFESGNGSLD
jgi:hypothetical protein